ncbi:hypothetical protein ACLESD_01235 [Pyxidicoccus sp. 3LFB2]
MDDNARRKEEIRRRLRLSQYPRRRDAVFTDENGHNPWILEDCPECRGQGRIDRLTENDTYVLETCSACEGLGTTTQVVRYFLEERPEALAMVDVHGWITCPHCGRRFSTRHRDTWTGRRHLTCGQLIRLAFQ